VLGNSNNSGSMVGACVDSRQSVLSRSEAARNVGTEDTVARGFVQTLEERELGGVEDVWRFKVVHRLDDNMGMRDQDFLIVELLRCRKVVLLSVCEEAGVHVLNRNRDSEALVRFNGGKVLWVGEL